MSEVVTRPPPAVHGLGRVTEAVERVEPGAFWTRLVGDTAVVTHVVMVARGRVLQLHPVGGSAHSPVWEGVVTLAGNVFCHI